MDGTESIRGDGMEKVKVRTGDAGLSSSANFGDVRVKFIDETKKLPLVVTPAGSDKSSAFLEKWNVENRAWLLEKITEHGAILFRGFTVDTPKKFESIARSVQSDLKNNYLGTSPRNGLTEYVFSASELPDYYPIPQHCEMSFTVNPPSRLFFCCLQPVEGEGGETPLVDFRTVYKEMNPEIRDRFISKGIRIIRNYCGPEGGSKFDLWNLKRWDEMFLTTDRKAIEEACRENAFDFKWKPNNILQLTSEQPATIKHPVTGEPVWFNHSQVFHLSTAPAEFRRIAKRQSSLRFWFLYMFSKAAVFFKRSFTSTEDQALHCTHADGTQISDSDLEHVRDVIWKNMTIYKWERGDVVAIDNFSIAHGRMPYKGPRTVVVCWA
jgi:hypothetical protein